MSARSTGTTATQSTGTTATLVALDEQVKPSLYELGDVCTIGRDPNCQIFVDTNDRIVSRVHAKIERSGPRYILADTASTNGTFINGSRIRGPYRLTNQDCIGLGSKQPILRFEDHDPTQYAITRDWLDYDETNMWFYLLNQRVELPIQQFRLLLHLYRHVGETCTREQCATIVWSEDFTPAQLSNLDETIRKLRENLGNAVPDDMDDRGQTVRDVREKLIVTRRGIGYVLYLHPDAADAESARKQR
jgi:DNA-binding response OmpR family regulator